MPAGRSLRSVCSTSCFASVCMILYLTVAAYNLYMLMFPLARVDFSNVALSDLVYPLWDAGSELDMRVYISTRSRFNVNFLAHEFSFEGNEENTNNDNNEDNKPKRNRETPSEDVALLWKQELSASSISKSFIITSLDDNDDSCRDDPSYRSATAWLDHAERTAMETGEGGVLSAINAAGQGLESTSFLLTMYTAISKQIQRLLAFLTLAPPVPDDNDNDAALAELMLNRTIIRLPDSSPLWRAIKTDNSTFYLHVLVLRHYPKSPWQSSWPPETATEAMMAVSKASKHHAVLLGQTKMIKFEIPHHIEKPKRILYHDLVYLWRRYVMHSVDITREHPPWEMLFANPQGHADYQAFLEMKKRRVGYPYWKPELSIKYVKDESVYPLHVADRSGMQLVRLPSKTKEHPTGVAHLPAVYSSEIGLTSDKYIPVNNTITTLPLRITMDRSDMEEDKHAKHATATAGAISPARWRLLTHFTEALEAQKALGFEQSDIDDVKRLIADTDVTLLSITMLASALHMLFEFLTFKSEVNFWRENKDLTGLSVRSLFMDVFGQTVILLFLIERDSSLLMIVPSAIGCLIAFWKCQRASGLRFVKFDKDKRQNTAPWNKFFRILGYELRAIRMEVKDSDSAAETCTGTANSNGNMTMGNKEKLDLTALTLESDRIATRTLGVWLLPLVVGYIIYSFLKVEHSGWYSWLITSGSSAVYALGFVMMTPQLFLNWKLKSVAHLPWRVLIYRSLNTFIDDLFSFIIRMPTMARISCFRDDVVFIIYLFQRWLYPVDASRPIEGGGGATADETTATVEKKEQ